MHSTIRKRIYAEFEAIGVDCSYRGVKIELINALQIEASNEQSDSCGFFKIKWLVDGG